MTEYTDEKEARKILGVSVAIIGATGSALILRQLVPPWAVMWLVSAIIFFQAKWLTWRLAITAGAAPSLPWLVGYWFLWPGMDALRFLGGRTPSSPPLAEWAFASAKMALGAAFLWIAPRRAIGLSPILAGWLGMLGVIFLLHFGGFHLLALGWQMLGATAKPIMRNPAAAVALGELWGRRWNLGFSDFARSIVFAPIQAMVAPGAATAAVFLFSGIVHELVISVPAGGGYGLPTAYFLLQLGGLRLQHSALARRLSIHRGWRARVVTFAFALLPVYWLLPPLWIDRVFLPFLHVISAL